MKKKYPSFPRLFAPALAVATLGLGFFIFSEHDSTELLPKNDTLSPTRTTPIGHLPAAVCNTSPAVHDPVACTDPNCSFRETPRDYIAEQTEVDLALPSGLPEAFEVEMTFEEQDVVLALQKHSVRGENTRVLLANPDGTYTEAALPPVSSYLGRIEGQNDLYISGHLTDEGLKLNIQRDFGDTWNLEPSESEWGKHTLARMDVDPKVEAIRKLRANECLEVDALAHDLQTAIQGFAPLPFLQAKRAELAGDFDYPFARQYLGHPGVPGDQLTQAQKDSIAASAVSSLEGLINQSVNPRFERSYAISWEVGTIVVRNDELTDPYRGNTGRTRFGVARNIWNGSGTPSNTFDTVVIGHGGSGLGGGVQGLAASNIASCSASSLGQFLGVGVHEIHHNWGHPHGIGRGSDMTPWGRWLSPSMINGSDTRKANYDEHITTMGNRASRGSRLENKTITTNVFPYAEWDTDASVIVGQGNSVLIDVLANDHDANGDEVRILDKFSSHPSTFVDQGTNLAGVPSNQVVFSSTTHRGGTVELVEGAPGQRDRVRYTSPASTNESFDVFHYYIEDTQGNEEFGMVKVGLVKPIVVSSNASNFSYDAGPASSHRAGSRAPLSPDTTGDVYWSQRPQSRDRFIDNGDPNTVFRDFVFDNVPRTLNHKIPNGDWQVQIIAGDRDNSFRGMTVRAEGGAVDFQAPGASRNQFGISSFIVEVTDGELNLEFINAFTGTPWVLNGISISRPQPTQVTVDTTQDVYNYDVGPNSAPVQSGWTGLGDFITGDISWIGSIDGVDRQTPPPTNEINRDFITSTSPATLRVKVDNGRWTVFMNMGDSDEARDSMRVSAEGGQVVRSNINSNAGQFTGVGFDVTVTDGFLDLEYSDEGGNANGWALTRLSLTRLATVDPSVTKYDYDVGPVGSPVLPNFTRLTNVIRGDIDWSPNPSAVDLGNVSGSNVANSDFITSTSPATLSHVVPNGVWRVYMNMGRPSVAFDQMRVSAENDAVVREGIQTTTGGLTNVSLEVPVTDGVLDLRFSDEGGSDTGWVVTRISLTQISNDPDGDSDNDNLPDIWERQYFNNSLTATAGLPSQDFDNDTLTDREEFIEGTDPTRADTDRDGLSDFAEINTYNTTPNNPDSDSDGFLDGDEVIQRSDPLAAASIPRLNGLVAYYPFDEGSGTTAFDIAPHHSAQNAEQEVGTVTWTTSDQLIGGGALDLNGSSALLAPDALIANGVGEAGVKEFTFSVWINPDGEGAFKGVFTGREGAGNWGINTEGREIDFRYGVSSGASVGFNTADDTILAADGWYHVAMTWESTSAGSEARMYLNGVNVITRTNVARNDYAMPTLGFFIGGDGTRGSRYFDGQIDDLSVFSRALSLAEVQQIHTAGNSGQSVLTAMAPPPLVAPELSDFIRQVVNGGSDDVSFSFETQANAYYDIYRSENLVDWERIQENVLGTGESMQILDENGAVGKPKLFYMVEQK